MCHAFPKVSMFHFFPKILVLSSFLSHFEEHEEQEEQEEQEELPPQQDLPAFRSLNFLYRTKPVYPTIATPMIISII